MNGKKRVRSPRTRGKKREREERDFKKIALKHATKSWPFPDPVALLARWRIYLSGLFARRSSRPFHDQPLQNIYRAIFISVRDAELRSEQLIKVNNANGAEAASRIVPQSGGLALF